MAEPRKRRRSLFGWLLRGLALLLLLAVAAVVVLFYTEWGQGKLRAIVRQRLEEGLGAPVAIGHSHIGLGGHATAEAVTIGDPAGGPAIASVAKLDLHIDLLDLIRGRVHLESVAVDGLELALIVGDDGVLNVSRLGGKSEAQTHLVVDRLAVTGSSVAYEVPGRSWHLHDLALDGGLAVDAWGLVVRVDRLEGQWDEVDRHVAVSGTYVLSGSRSVVVGADASLGDSSIHAALLSHDGATGRGAAATLLELHIDDAAAVAGALGVPTDAWRDRARVVRGAALLGFDAHQLRGWLTGSIDDTPLRAWGSFDLDRRTARASLAVEGLDPRRVDPRAPSGALDLRVSASGNVDALSGSVSVDASGRVADVDVTSLHATAATAGGGYQLGLAVDTARGHVDGDAVVRQTDGAWSADRFALHGRVPERLSLPAEQLSGRLRSLDVTGHGPLAAPSVTATAVVDDLRWQELRAAGVTVHLSTTAPLSRDGLASLGGRVTAVARGVRYGDRRAAELRLAGSFARAGQLADAAVSLRGAAPLDRASVNLHVERSGTRTRIVARDLELLACGDTLRLARAAATLRAGGAFDIERTTVSLPAGEVIVEGGLDGARARAATRRLAIRAAELDLSDLPACLGAPALSGRASLDLVLGRARAGLSVRGTVGGTDVVAGSRPAVSGSATLQLEPGVGHVDGQVSIAGASITFSADGAAPRNLADAAAWAALRPADVRAASADSHHLTAAAVADFTGRPLPADLDGTVDGTLELTAGASSLVAHLDLLVARAAGVRDLASHVDATWSASGLEVSAAPSQAGEPIVSGTVRLAAPLAPALRGELGPLMTAGLDGTLVFDGFDLARLSRAGLTPRPVAGTLSASVALSGSIDDPVVTVSDGHAMQLLLDRVRFRQVDFEGGWQRGNWRANLSAFQKSGGDLIVRASQTSAGISFAVRAHQFDLSVLRAFEAGGTGPLAEAQGILDADVTLSGTRAAPRARGTLTVHGGRVLLQAGTRRVDDIVATATLRDRGGIEVHARALTAGGKATLDGTLIAPLLQPQSFDATFAVDRVGFTAGTSRGRVDTRGTLRGQITGGEVRAQVVIDGGTVQLKKTRSGLQPLESMPDVVYVDERGKQAKTEKGRPWPTVRIALSAKRAVQLQTPEADLRVDPKLDIVFENLALTSITGRVTILRGSTVSVFDRPYDVVVGELQLDGANFANPRIRAQLNHDFPLATVVAQVDGTLKEPRIQLSTDVGSYDDAQILAIMLGEDPTRTDEGRGGAETGAAVAGYAIGNFLREKLPLGISVFIPHADGFEIGRWIAEGVLATYRYRAPSAVHQNVNEAGLDWYLRHNLILEGRYGDATVGNLDLLWVLRF